MLGARKARRAARMYYLDCVPIDRIAEKLECRRQEVLDVIDDPGQQQKYVDEAAKVRRRLRLRAAAAADAALEKQVEFVSSDVEDPTLVAAQQRTAAQLMRVGMMGDDDGKTITIRFEHGMPTIGGPASGGYREGSVEHAASGSVSLRFDGSQG